MKGTDGRLGKIPLILRVFLSCVGNLKRNIFWGKVLEGISFYGKNWGDFPGKMILSSNNDPRIVVRYTTTESVLRVSFTEQAGKRAFYSCINIFLL